jgi:hypothetical protein
MAAWLFNMFYGDTPEAAYHPETLHHKAPLACPSILQKATQVPERPGEIDLAANAK